MQKVKLATICEVFSGSSAPQARSYFDTNGKPFVRVSDLGNRQSRILIETRDRVNEAAIKEKRLVLAKKGTVIFPKSGAAILTNSRAILGVDAYIVGHLAALYPKDNVDSVYLYYFLCGIDMGDYVPNVGYPSLNLSTIKEIEVPIPFKNNQPDLEEQKRIVDKIEKLFMETERGYEKTELSLKNSTVFLYSQIEKLIKNPPNNWKKFRLCDLCISKSGNNNLIKGKQIQNYTRDLYPAFSATGQDIWREDYDNEGSAIIVSAVGARCGKCFKADGKWTAVANTHIIYPKENINRDFLWFFINNENFWEKGGAAQPFVKIKESLNKKSISVPVDKNQPDLSEQKRIVEKLNRIKEQSELLMERYKEQLENFNKLKQSILNEAFLGKLVAAEEPVLQRVNIFPIQQAIGAVLQQFERGEMIIAKVLYLAQTINRVPLGISFTPQSFGPYDTAVKKAITAGLSRGNNFFARKKYGKGFVYTLSPNAKKLFKYSNSKVLRTMNSFLNEMMPHFKKSSSADIERLASVCEIVRETKNIDEKEVFTKLSEWKPNKFNLQEVQRTLKFIKTKGWDKILIK